MATVKEAEPTAAALSSERLAGFLADIARDQPDRERILFVCVGTDRSTGDSLGPLVGTMLAEHGWPNVIGTLAEPCDAHKVAAAAASAASATQSQRDTAWTVVAIDACLGKPQSVGGYVLTRGSLQPGAATGRRLPPIGDYGIAGVVNRHGPKAYGMLQTTSLHLVMGMAKAIVSAVNEAWYIQSKQLHSVRLAERSETHNEEGFRMNGKPGIDAQTISIANGSVTLASGLELSYYDSKDMGADGPVLVLLHGYCGSSSYWEQVIGDLSSFARVIAPDMRGHGISAAPADEIYTMEAFAGDVEELLEQLCIDQAAMLGHSLGGYVTLAYAERYGSRLSSFGLVHSTTLPDSEAARENRDKAVAAIEGEGIDVFVEGLVPKLFAADRLSEREMQVARGKEIGRGASQHGAAATARGMKERPDRGYVIRETKIPVLIVAGAKDGVIPAASAFAATGDTTKRVELEEAGHMSMLECPEELTAAIRDFLI